MSMQLPDSSLNGSRRTPSPRPSLRGTRSFSRMEPTEADSDPLRSSLSRLQTETAILEPHEATASPQQMDDDDEPAGSSPGSTIFPDGFPEGFDELPPELVNLTNRFIDSLSRPIHASPPGIVQLSEMFQQFYTTAFKAVEEHISNSYLSLSSKQRSSSAKAPTQMLSLSEITQKKRDRKMLEAKKLALEEAVEKKVTEGVYDRIWRHKTTDDEARDESLRSKMAALKVVGVNMTHLGVELSKSKDSRPDVDTELQPAVEALLDMSLKKYPLGKLLCLKQAHKAIVDCLTNHIDSASADFILPTLIYTLIIAPPTPAFNVISDLYFIQRFRAAKAVDGEAAYCLTNLEAAISFLETVDLATLKMDESEPTDGSASEKPEAPAPLTTETPDPLNGLSEKLAPHAAASPETTHASVPSTAAKRIGTHASASSSTSSLLQTSTPGGRTRKLSYLTPIDIAANAVSTADQGLRNIGSSLEGSYKFLFGKLDRQGQGAPKTLEDARKLVDSPPLLAEHGFLAAIDGVLKRKSSDTSLRSANSGSTGAAAAGEKEKTAGTGQEKENKQPTAGTSTPTPQPPLPRAATLPVVDQVGESVKNFGNQLGRFAGIGVMRGFSRSASTTTSSQPVAATGTGAGSGKDKERTGTGLGIVVKDENGRETHKRTESGTVVDLLTTFPDLAADLNTKREEKQKIKVSKKFSDVAEAGDLKLSEVSELLREYHRLVQELGQRGLAEEE